jgi:hypothetical protein
MSDLVLWLGGACSTELSELVPSNSPQPRSESAATVLPVVSDFQRDGAKDFLPHIRRIVFLQTRATSPSVDERSIQLSEPPPCITILLLRATQQRL